MDKNVTSRHINFYDNWKIKIKYSSYQKENMGWVIVYERKAIVSLCNCYIVYRNLRSNKYILAQFGINGIPDWWKYIYNVTYVLWDFIRHI